MRISHVALPSCLLFWLPLGLGTGACATANDPPPPPQRPGAGGGTAQGGSSGVAGGTGGTTGGTGSATGGTGTTGGSGGTTGGTGATGGTSAATGGTAGSSSVEACGQSVGAAADKNIDDLEDGDNTIGNGMTDPNPPVRVGYWFTYNEKTDNPSSACTQMPPPDPMGLLPFPPTADPGNGSLFGAHTSGRSCTSTWGAGIGVDFNNCNMKSNVYDASAYTGISFWYKSTQPVRALISTQPNLPTAQGGQCTDSDCYNHHGKNFAAAAAGTTATITWAELRGTMQIGSPPMDPQSYGTKRTFDPSQLLGMQVQVDQDGGANFDLWLDDLTFL